jgi:transcriptional regulator with XRE-family HTH domain
MHKVSVREKVFNLRHAGYSYSYIASQTGLSKGTLSDWLAEVPYHPNAHTLDTIGKARTASGEAKTQIKQRSLLKAREEAVNEIGDLSNRDLFMFGIGLYLGEGSKTANVVRVVNSDVNVIRLAIAWFKSLGVLNNQFGVTLHLYPDSNVKKCLQFWSEATTIPLGQFAKSQIDRRTNKKLSRAGKLPYGTAHLSVKSGGRKEFGVFFARKILGWIDSAMRKAIMRA